MCIYGIIRSVTPHYYWFNRLGNDFIDTDKSTDAEFNSTFRAWKEALALEGLVNDPDAVNQQVYIHDCVRLCELLVHSWSSCSAGVGVPRVEM